MQKTSEIPFEFVVEKLFSLEPRVRPMFGCQAVYVGEKIMMILRNKPGVHEDDNGIWLATKAEHHDGLKKIFPSMRPIQVLGKTPNWQIIPVEADDFEESAMKVCELILKGDLRIGNIPKPRKKKTVDKPKAKKKPSKTSQAKSKPVRPKGGKR